MALKITEARPIERKITVPSGVKGFKDREFTLKITSTGFALHEKGRRRVYRSISITDFIRWMMTHAGEREV